MRRRSLLLCALLCLLPALIPGRPAQAAMDDYFVSTAWLAAHRAQVVVIDVRPAPLYLLGHIEGALHMDRGAFLASRGGVGCLLPVRADFEALMDRYGVTPDTTVVACAQDDNPYAARLVWTLLQYGHGRARVLDGGVDKWAQEGRPTALLPTPAAAASGYRSGPGRPLLAESGEILDRLEDPEMLVWDVRRRGEYEGREVRAARGGHIPGGVHLDWTALQQEAGGVRVVRGEPELRALLEGAGITAGREVIAHCQSGIRSAYATLVLLGLGYRARNYDGSWLEWGNSATLPVALPESLAGH